MTDFEQHLLRRPSEIIREQKFQARLARRLTTEEKRQERKRLQRKTRGEEKYRAERVRELEDFANQNDLLAKIQSIATQLSHAVQINKKATEKTMAGILEPIIESKQASVSFAPSEPHLFYSIAYGSHRGFPLVAHVEGAKTRLHNIFGVFVNFGTSTQPSKQLDVYVLHWKPDHKKIGGDVVFRPEIFHNAGSRTEQFSAILMSGYDFFLKQFGKV